MAVPISILEYADFRKPLGDKIVVFVHTGTAYRTRDFREEFDAKFDGLFWLHRLGQPHEEHGLIVDIVVVWLLECHGWGQVDLCKVFFIDQVDGIDAAIPPIIHSESFHVSTPSAGFCQESAHVVLEGVPIQMKP